MTAVSPLADQIEPAGTHCSAADQVLTPEEPPVLRKEQTFRTNEVSRHVSMPFYRGRATAFLGLT